MEGRCVIDRLNTFLRRCVAALGIATAASCATAPAPAPTPVAAAAPRPALWEVSDPDTKIYLFGTIHLLPKESQWRTPALEQAIGQSQGLFLETIIDEANPRELAGVMASIGFAEGL